LAEVQSNPIDIGDSLNQAWRGFAATWVPWVLSALVFFLATIVILLVLVVPTIGALAVDPQSQSGAAATVAVGSTVVAFLAIVVVTVFAVIWQLNCWRNALRVIRGENIELKDFFRVAGLGVPFVVQLLVGLIVGAGYLAFFLPGVILAVILVFAAPAVFVLRDASVGTAFSLSWRVVSAHLGSVILLVLLSAALGFVGGLVVVGSLVTVPLNTLLITHVLQKNVGGPAVTRG
jgi:hypothetical protein